MHFNIYYATISLLYDSHQLQEICLLIYALFLNNLDF